MEEGEFTPVIEGIEMLKVGDKAPIFEVSDVYGNRVNLADKIGEDVIVLIFWSIYCDPCRNSMPAYNEIQRKYKEKGLEFLTINMDGEEMSDAIRAYLENDNIELPVLLDEPAGDFLKIADPYGVQGTPTIYIIDRRGRISFGKVGTVSFESLSSLVSSELKKK
jgi:peroxiredoxin